VGLEPDQQLYAVFAGEAGEQAVAVLVDATGQSEVTPT
jgi:hypothetical protein